MPGTAPSPADRLLELIDKARVVVAFTGAGISTESGVPDFRSAGSPWLKNKPIDFEDFIASEAAQIEAWRRKFTMDDLYRGAQPSLGHRALSTLVASGKCAVEFDLVSTPKVNG